jgi:putative glutamine amidotransferase
MATTLPEGAPVIGISGGGPMSESVKSMIRQVEAAGAKVILLTNHEKRNPANDINKIDALVVMGNNADIDPAKYGAARHPKTYSEMDSPEGRTRAAYEEQLMQHALAQGVPLLGVCGGLQRLNVLCGGTLHQHVPDLTGHDEHAQQSLDISFSTPVQPVIIENNSTLGNIADTIRAVYAPAHSSNLPSIVMENSMHHQAVDRVGQGLRAVAFAEDEITTANGKQRLVEAVEADPNGRFGNQFVMGVQWHPEFGASPLGEKIATHLVGEARQFAITNQRQHAPEEIERENALSREQTATPPSPPKNVEAKPVVRTGSMAEMVLQRRAAASKSLERT